MMYSVFVLVCSIPVVLSSLIPKPTSSFDLKTRKVTILSMSSTDAPEGSYWWKWFIPSYYDDYLQNKTFGPKNREWNDGSICQIRMYGIAEKSRMKHYAQGGIASLKDDSSPQHLPHSVKCYYMTTQGSWIDDAVFLRVAISCPVMANDVVFASTSNSDKGGKKAKKNSKTNHYPCGELNTMKKTYVVTLFPSKSTRSEIFPVKAVESIGISASISPMNSSNSVTGSSHDHAKSGKYKGRNVTTFFTPLHNNNGKLPLTVAKRQNTPVIIATIQTFKNPTSGISLWLFARYHSLLGANVLIYDRFGRHYEYIKDLIEEFDIMYYVSSSTGIYSSVQCVYSNGSISYVCFYTYSPTRHWNCYNQTLTI